MQNAAVLTWQNGLGRRWNRVTEPAAPRLRIFQRKEARISMKLILFCLLLIVCWPAALLAVILYPFVWLLLLPFRIVGIAVGGVLDLVGALFRLPARLVRAI